MRPPFAISKLSIKRDNSRTRPVYTVQGHFVEGATGLVVPDSPMWDGALSYDLEKECGTDLRYRGVKGSQLDDVLQTGSDIPGMAKGGHIFAAYSIEKASEYGRTRGVISVGTPLQDDLCIIIYHADALEMAEVPGAIEGKDYEHIFLKEPLEALVGCVMLKPKK